jgi:serine/arginine repetitive matrix protein 2
MTYEEENGSKLICLRVPFRSRVCRFPEEDILSEVSALRTKLLAALPARTDPKLIKQHDTHSLAAAKEAELTRMRGAFGVGANYKEGAAFDREEQARLKEIKKAGYEEKDRLRLERARGQEKREEERKEEEKKRRRDAERA